MTEQQRPDYHPPAGSITEHEIKLKRTKLRYRATAEWLTLRKREVPFAEIFSVTYQKLPVDPKRPITFVLNGGPGASSAYLHVGALGPRRVTFNPSGGLPPPPTQLLDNQETWLSFSDLVFIDPVGTGLSRTLDDVRFEKNPPRDENEEKLVGRGESNKEYFGVKRDLESIGEFIQRSLDKHGRWLSPAYLAGESYGGYRVARLARVLQESYGVGLCGIALISPALELASLLPSDYNISHWIETFPSMALAAVHHGRSKEIRSKTKPDRAALQAEEFATTELVRLLASGDSLQSKERQDILKRQASFLGLSSEFTDIHQGRIPIERFSGELLRDERKIIGLYDASCTVISPFPDREGRSSPDPTLSQLEFVFCSGVNHLIRAELKLSTDRRYRLLSDEVNRSWKNDAASHYFDTQFSATDDLRYGMALNPHMQVWITHGWYDLVTPYFGSKRLLSHMKLTEDAQARVHLSTYFGGHMYYTWDVSREQFAAEAHRFMK